MGLSVLWVVLGTIVLVLGLLDVFLTALNYDEAGFLAARLCALQWRCLRGVTRRLSRRWRPTVLRQVTGLNIMLNVVTWLGCVVVGFGLIYYGLMLGKNFQYDGQDLGEGAFAAMYLSAAQLATVGTSQVSPETDALRALSILETLTGVALMTLILSFLFGVYGVVRDLRTLSANFVTAEQGVGDPLARLEAYFPEGRPVGLDGSLQAISDSFWSYADGLRQHHAAYYFQSGRDQFSLPYVLHMLGQTIAALRWGLPSGHPVSVYPLLTQLSSQFEQFTDYLHHEVGWTSTAVPEVVSVEDFSAAYHAPGQSLDLWLGRFLRVNQDMARMVRRDLATDPGEAYQRYQRWLPFAFRAEQVTAAVSRDLDYQPIIHGGERARLAVGGAVAVPERAQSWRALLNRWVIVPDPGLTRLFTAASATLAAIAAVLSVYPLLTFFGVPAFPPAMFAGQVGMLAASMPRDTTAARRKITTLLMAVPAIGAAALGAAVAPSFAVAIPVLAVVVLLGVWARGFGPRLGTLGQMAFMAFYFGLLLHPPAVLLPAFAGAAVTGAIWAYLFRFVFLAQRPDRVLLAGLAAFRARLILLLDPLIDAVSAARWDPDLRKRVGADARRLHQCATFLEGQLRLIDPAELGSAEPSEARLRLFDAELAANNVTAATSHVACAGATIHLVLRAQLAGLLEQAQTRLRRLGSPVDDQNDADVGRLSDVWPQQAQRLHGAIHELVGAFGILHQVETAAVADPHAAAQEIGDDGVGDDGSGESDESHGPQPPVSKPPQFGPLSPAGRQAIQVALATALALIAGAAVTSTHQYWASLAAFVVLASTETLGETIVKGVQRVAGTIIGAIVGFGVAIFTGADPFVVLPLIAVSVFAEMYLQPVSYALMVFWITMMISLLYEFLGTLKPEALEIRVMETVLGAAIALAVAAFLLPARTRQKVNGEGVTFLQMLDDVIQTCLKRLAGTGEIHSLAAQALTLGQRLRQLTVSAGPMRRGFGALRRDGVERRLTASAALTYYARHLITTAEKLAPGAAVLTVSMSAQLSAMTGDNIAALVQVLTGEPPGPTHGSEDFPIDSRHARNQADVGGAVGEAALHHLVRINQSVLRLIDDLTDDAATNA